MCAKPLPPLLAGAAAFLKSALGALQQLCAVVGPGGRRACAGVRGQLAELGSGGSSPSAKLSCAMQDLNFSGANVRNAVC